MTKINYELIYESALKLIGEIYNKSKYDNNVDLYRIYDIVNSLDKNQIKSKEWLVNTLIEYLPEINKKYPRIFIAGGWYGLTAAILKQKLNVYNDIISCDIDPMTKSIGERLTNKQRVFFKIDNAVSHFIQNRKDYNILINTSCEHMEQDDLEFMCDARVERTIVCFQSNNYHEIDSHINCHDSLSDFIDSLSLKNIIYKNEQILPNCTRYMVIGS